jgi:hypothetical protein
VGVAIFEMNWYELSAWTKTSFSVMLSVAMVMSEGAMGTPSLVSAAEIFNAILSVLNWSCTASALAEESDVTRTLITKSS